MQKIWQRFLYIDAVLLEAERQKTTYGYTEDWATNFLQLNEDDVFTTFVQVYKLAQFTRTGIVASKTELV